MEILIERDLAVLIDTQDISGEFVEEVMNIADFEKDFSISLNNVTSVVYAPFKNQYFITYGENDLKVFDSPDKNEVLNHIHINREAIRKKLKLIWLKNRLPSPFHTIDEDSEDIIITTENAILLEASNKLSEAKTYLADTDWIIVKISEMQLEGVDINILKEKYKEELINRTYYRNLINQLEGESNE